jgi:hypothetical protein
MDLATLKAQNEAEEKAKAEAEAQQTTGDDDQEPLTDSDDEIQAEAEETDGENTSDSEDDTEDDTEDTEDVELWQREDDGKTVPLGVLKDTRNKLKGRISERNEEIEKLKAEIEALKKKPPESMPETGALKPPKEFDYDTDEEYQAALENYHYKSINHRFELIEKNRRDEQRQRQAMENLTKSVDKHYERAAKLVSESGIDPEIYKNSDMTVRRSIETMRPNEGDIITDQLIDILGDGSEKVMYYLGRNKPALNQFMVLLSEDPAGIKAAAYLGEQKARLTVPQKRTSNARPPATKIKGDATTNNSAKRLLKKYQEAHKKGNVQTAYNIKKEARQAKIDVSNW